VLRLILNKHSEIQKKKVGYNDDQPSCLVLSNKFGSIHCFVQRLPRSRGGFVPEIVILKAVMMHHSTPLYIHICICTLLKSLLWPNNSERKIRFRAPQTVSELHQFFIFQFVTRIQFCCRFTDLFRIRNLSASFVPSRADYGDARVLTQHA